MATAGIVIKGEFPELKELRAGIRGLGDKKFTSEALKESLERAIFPAYLRMRELTPLGPTGNLKRAASFLAKAYAKSGNAVGLIGYRRAGTSESNSAQGGNVEAGPDRAFHQWLVEYGTKPRYVGKFSNTPYQRRSPSQPFTRIRNGKQEVVRGKGVPHTVRGQNAYIASSYKSLGPFEIVPTADGRVTTDPPYQRAFFMKSKTPIVIQPSPPGGRSGVPPVRVAFEQTQGQVAAILASEMRLKLQRAIDTLTIRDTGTLSGVS